MTCEELRAEYEMYALDLAEEPERSELRAHLGRGCEVCVAGMRQARGMMAFLGATAPAVAPPARLRKRILASVGVEKSGWGWTPLWIAVSACCLLAGFYFYGRERGAAEEMARLRVLERRQSVELARLNEALVMLNAPDTRQVNFGAGARGKVFVNPGGVLLLAANLPPAPAGKIYEMWVIPKGANPVPAGLFQSSAEGTAMHLLNRPMDMTTMGAVAVTLEAAGGAPQPTSQPLIVAPLGG